MAQLNLIILLSYGPILIKVACLLFLFVHKVISTKGYHNILILVGLVDVDLSKILVSICVVEVSSKGGRRRSLVVFKTHLELVPERQVVHVRFIHVRELVGFFVELLVFVKHFL